MCSSLEPENDRWPWSCPSWTELWEWGTFWTTTRRPQPAWWGRLCKVTNLASLAKPIGKNFSQAPKLLSVGLGTSLFLSMDTVNLEIDCVSVFALATGKLRSNLWPTSFTFIGLYQTFLFMNSFDFIFFFHWSLIYLFFVLCMFFPKATSHCFWKEITLSK